MWGRGNWREIKGPSHNALLYTEGFFPLPDFVVCLVNKLVHGIPSKLAEEEKEEGEEVEVVGMRARGEKEEKASN